VNNAGSGSRILRLRRKIPLLFGEKSFETVCFDSFIFRNRLLNRRAIQEVRSSGVAEVQVANTKSTASRVEFFIAWKR
jgi:hypothetical protein